MDSPRKQLLDIITSAVEVIDQEVAKWAEDPGTHALTSDDLAVVQEVRQSIAKLRDLPR